MTDKQLKNKAVNIQGKSYVLVSDRVLYFNEQYKNGSIQTELLSELNDPNIVIRAIVVPDATMPDRKFTGYSQEKVGDGFINKTSALENAETSAVGRALAMMGIGVIESIASADEINKAQNQSAQQPRATEKQVNTIYDTVARITGMDNKEGMDKWLEEKTGATPDKLSVKAAGAVITKLFAAEKARKAEDARPDPTTDDVAEVTDQDIEDLKAGKVPY
jgi:hypothetical protein